MMSFLLLFFAFAQQCDVLLDERGVVDDDASLLVALNSSSSSSRTVCVVVGNDTSLRIEAPLRHNITSLRIVALLDNDSESQNRATGSLF